MLYDPKWDKKRWEDEEPGIPVRNHSLLLLMVTLPWIVLFGMVGLAVNTMAEIAGVHVTKHIGR